jgi:tetratricopeptide (TPR) repeat protein
MKTTRLRIPLLSLLLFAATFALFFPATSFSLVNFDDPVFITHNPILFNGFSWDAVRRAFTGLYGDECMYVPLLWVSFLFDLKLFGATAMDPWGFHFGNVLVHAANSVLLFHLLLAFCKKPWRAFFFAALWSLHPLRVESVAWVTSRKDILSTFFALLAVGAYVWAWLGQRGATDPAMPAARPARLPLVAAFAFFLMGLLVKPMLVTIPCLMLLLDAWPLRRMGTSFAAARRTLPRLLFEKSPFFLCAAIAAGAVYLTQTKAITHVPLWVRLYCIPSNYLFYLNKFIFPVHLHAMVPREPISIPSFLLAIGILGAISVWAWRRRQQQPNELIGWLAFLGLLFPVIGIVIIGVYPVADRYTYLPAMGLSIALLSALPANGGLFSGRGFRAGVFVAALGILGVLGVLTARHLPSWKNDESLYTNIARHHSGHYGAIHYFAREELFANGNLAKADQMTDQLLAQKPTVSFGLVLKIICLSQLRSTEAAYSFALAHYPPSDNLGNPGVYEGYLTFLAFFSGDHDQARFYMQETFRRSVFEPKSQEQLHALAMLLAHERGDETTALEHARRIASLRDKTRLAPEDFFLAYTTLWSSGLHLQTLPFFQRLVHACSDRPDILNNVAWLLATTAGSPAAPEEILGMVRQALSNAPQHPVILDTLSVAQAYAGDYDAALQTAQQLAAVLAISPAADAPSMLRKVQKRIDLYRERRPFREDSSGRLLYAP